MRATLKSSSEADHDALNPLCEALGVEGRNLGLLELSIDGRKVTVAIGNRARWNGTTQTYTSQLTAEVNVFFERGGTVSDEARKNPPSIVLRRERKGDVADKDRGLVKELQTGFAGFDRAVFIDHDSTEADARRVLSKEATRQAVIALIDQGLALHWGLRSVRVTLPVDADRPPDARFWGAVLEDLLIASKAGGLRDAAPARSGEALLTVSIVFAALSAVAAALADGNYRTDTVLPYLIVAVVGGLTAFFTRPFIERAFAGHSASGKWSFGATLCWAITGGALTLAALLTANARLDQSEPHVRHGVVVSVYRQADADDRRRGFQSRSWLGRSAVTIRWQSGSESTVNTGSWFDVGEKVTETRRAGGLGFDWSWLEHR